MLKYEDSLQTQSAAQVRVTARELMEALASLEARKARQDFEQVGTVTLAEAIQDCSVEATPTEIQAEVDFIRATDTILETAKCRSRRLRLVLTSELILAGLCLLTVVGLQHTLFNKKWQQAYQREDFQQKLRQSAGAHPRYEIDVVPEDGRWGNGSQTNITTYGRWANLPVYPLHSLPDGYDIHHFDGLDDEGRNTMSPFFGRGGAYVEFREIEAPFFRDNVSVYYNGIQYWRGAIRKQDIPRLLHGRYFTLYPAIVSNSQYKISDIVPLTVSMDSIEVARGQWGQAYPQCYALYQFRDGAHVHLDEHAWEQYPGSPSK